MRRAIAAVVLLASATAHAEDDEEARERRAYALMVEGQARFDLGRFDDAIALLQNAYQTYPYPEALYGLGQAYRMKKDYEHAVFFYKSYLRNAPANARERAVVEERLAEMEKLSTAQKESSQKPPQGIETPPPPVTSPTAPVTKPAPVLAPKSARAPAPTSIEPWYTDAWGWSITAAGVATATVGTWAVVDGQGTCRVQDQYCGGNPHEQVWGWATLGVGSALIVTGVVKLVAAPAEPKRFQLVFNNHFVGVAGTF